MTKHVLVVLLALATAVPIFAQDQTNKRAQAYYHFSKARLLDDQGQASQAIDEYKKALELGGTDEGAPGRRGGEKGPYIGYFRDLDGNKLNAICMG